MDKTFRFFSLTKKNDARPLIVEKKFADDAQTNIVSHLFFCC